MKILGPTQWSQRNEWDSFYFSQFEHQPPGLWGSVLHFGFLLIHPALWSLGSKVCAASMLIPSGSLQKATCRIRYMMGYSFSIFLDSQVIPPVTLWWRNSPSIHIILLAEGDKETERDAKSAHEQKHGTKTSIQRFLPWAGRTGARCIVSSRKTPTSPQSSQEGPERSRLETFIWTEQCPSISELAPCQIIILFTGHREQKGGITLRLILRLESPVRAF